MAQSSEFARFGERPVDDSISIMDVMASLRPKFGDTRAAPMSMAITPDSCNVWFMSKNSDSKL